MSDVTDTDIDVEDEAGGPEKRSRAPLLIAIALFAALGGGGFFATFSGAFSLPFLAQAPPDAEVEEAKPSIREELLGVAYLPLDELVVPLSPQARARLLLFKAEIEVDEADLPAITALKPRILDVFNTFLRAVEERDLEAPSATLKLRAQLLRRLRVIADPVKPRDVLITSFVLK